MEKRDTQTTAQSAPRRASLSPGHNWGRPGQRADEAACGPGDPQEGESASPDVSLCANEVQWLPCSLGSELRSPHSCAGQGVQDGLGWQAEEWESVHVALTGTGAALAAHDNSERVVSVAEVNKKPLLPKGPQKQK